MNIFFLDYDVTAAARAHVDKHVVKMILEYAQLLSTAHRYLDGYRETYFCEKKQKTKTRWKLDNPFMDRVLYNATHLQHPSLLWVIEDRANYDFLYSLFLELCAEYTYRYDKTHLSEVKLSDILMEPPENIKDACMTPLKLAMPDEYKTDCPVESYRAYYRDAKADLATWKNRSKPEWY